jgi:hypothetical protein
MKKENESEMKKVKLYKMNYMFDFQIESNFKAQISEYELFDSGDAYLDECGEEVIKKYMLGKLNEHTHSMWLLNKDVDYYINALIEKHEEVIREHEKFINSCKDYKKTVETKKRKKVKVYCFMYSFATGLSRFEYDATEYDVAYAISRNTMIDKNMFDEIDVRHETGRVAMFSLVDDKDIFMKKVMEYIQKVN